MQEVLKVLAPSLISAAVTLIVCLINNQQNHNKLTAELKARDEMQMYRIEQLEKKQDVHNNVIEKTYKLQEDVELLKAEDKRHNERLKALEVKYHDV